MASVDLRIPFSRFAVALATASTLLLFGAFLSQIDGQVSGVQVHRPAVGAVADSSDRIDRERLLRHQSILAHDSMEGRKAGTPGNRRARSFLLLQVDRIGLDPVRGTRSQEFRFTGRRDGEAYEGLNIMGMIEGSEHPGRFIVVTAHYDHLGVSGDEIFNGADDNASGTAALLELAHYFRANPPAHSLVFVALDAEEQGLEGARTWVDAPPVPIESIALNVNLDMISRSEAGELYAAGTHHYPFLIPWIEAVAARAPVTLLMGHDSPDLPPGDDWTMASDHAPFHGAGIPFIYFGVEDHEGYHHPSDTFERTTPKFYGDAVETILEFLLLADRDGF
ncbi:MAG: M28 family peptidase [Gemmatimonadota bacterium]